MNTEGSCFADPYGAIICRDVVVGNVSPLVHLNVRHKISTIRYVTTKKGAFFICISVCRNNVDGSDRIARSWMLFESFRRVNVNPLQHP